MTNKNVLIFTGAGISADSGIPTFRDNNGLWENYKIEDVATPNGFHKNPQLVWDFYKQRHDQLKDIIPNAAHHAIPVLEQQLSELGYKTTIITQNIDRLHQAAGSYVYELHGNLHDVKCSQCNFVDYTLKFWENVEIPHCPICNSYLRPNVVWFGEIPNQEAYYIGSDTAENCAALLIIGTSLQVQPAAGLAYRAKQLGAYTIECNLVQHYKIYDTSYKFLRGNAIDTVPVACDIILKRLTPL